MTQIDKWIGRFSPLLGGRFDFFRAGDGPRFDAWHNALCLTRGRFWVRIRGGHDLRRAAGRPPALTDPMVGRADGRGATLSTFPWVGHPPGSQWWYALHVVGAGGVADDRDAPRVRAAFDGSGALAGPSSNAPTMLCVRPLPGGRFRVTWRYDETGQEAAPADFRLYNDAASPGAVDYDQPVATVAYRFRAGVFEYVSGPFVHGTRVTWAARAYSAAGAEERNTATAAGTADAQGPEQAPTLVCGTVM